MHTVPHWVPNTVLKDIWIWNIFYNTNHLCLATALIGYKHLFPFNKIDILSTESPYKGLMTPRYIMSYNI
jgi:hypothetical protein